MKKQDLREYSDNELSLWVFNDESLYRMRRSLLKDQSILNECFEYTSEQLDVLIQDINDDLESE